MRYLPLTLLIALACVSPWAHSQACNSADRAVALILDASGSMHARLPSGETRIAAAQKAVKGVASLVDPNAQLGLRVYGAKSPARDKNCEDSHVAVALAPASKAGPEIQQAVGEVKAQGWTPIAFSLEQAAADFPPSAKERAIILVSDGKETCKGDPVVAARALGARGIVIHTIGYAVDSAAKMQLEGIARASGGKYFDAPDGPELATTLKSAFAACRQKPAATPVSKNPGKLRTTGAQWLTRHPVLDESGKEVGQLDSARMEIPLPPGIYEVRFGPNTWKGIEVRPAATTTISPATLVMKKNVSAKLVDTETGAEHASLDAVSAKAVVMPGVYDLVFANDVRWPYLKLDGGKTLTLEPVEVRVNRPWKTARVLLEGRQVAHFDAVTSRVRLPPGEYVVEIDGKPHPFSAPRGGEEWENK
ncbi:MAG TPA: VWA domain-containing protein [Usitatibacter sp.]|nr:VWA domain-containing protein [Usitatibacter sp.]